MSIYKDVPEIADAESVKDLIAKAEKLIIWGSLNLPEIRRAQDIGRHEGLSEGDQTSLALALMIKSYTVAMNGWLETAQMVSPSVVSSESPLLKPRNPNDHV